MHTSTAALLLSTLVLATDSYAGTVVIPEASYGVYVVTLVGRQGSVAGPFSQGVGPITAPVGAAGGTFGGALHSDAGPVEPGEIVSLPGTTAIANSDASASIQVTPLGAQTTLQLNVSAAQSVVMMDGGGYLSEGGGSFTVTFTVDATTAYALTGTLNMDSEDPVAYTQFVGQPFFVTPAGNGPVNLTGTLAPGTYILRGSTSSRAPFFNINTGDDSDGSSISLTLTLSATLGGACDSIDFNNDTSFFDPQDIDAFLSVYSEGPCIPESATCNDIDFNNDGSLFDPCDIDSFLLVFSEGPCTPCGQ